jgi:hypothetical protein
MGNGRRKEENQKTASKRSKRSYTISMSGKVMRQQSGQKKQYLSQPCGAPTDWRGLKGHHASQP